MLIPRRGFSCHICHELDSVDVDWLAGTWTLQRVLRGVRVTSDYELNLVLVEGVERWLRCSCCWRLLCSFASALSRAGGA